MNSDEVRMWVYEETLPNGEKLTDVINQTNVRTSQMAIHFIPILYPMFFIEFRYFNDSIVN
jgi:hypothetical protein